MARRLHKIVRDTTWLTSDGLNVRITPSIGVASYPTDSRTKLQLLQLADDAMYDVKNSTRDGVCASGQGRLVIS